MTSDNFTAEDMEFWRWLKQTAFFRDDAIEQFKALGLDDNTACYICISSAFKARDVFELWYDFPEYQSIILKWLNNHKLNYEVVSG